MVSLDMDDEEDSNTSSTATDNILGGLNGGTTSGRSVSNNVHDRSRLTSTSAPSVNGGLSTTTGKHHHSRSTRNSTSSTSSQQQHHHHHHNSSRRTDGERISSSSSSTSTAKESFLNYFFGQNGPGPVAGANISEVHGHLNRVGGTVGRDVSGPDSMAGAFGRAKGVPVGDGSDAAFDMKSLGRHIEAVSRNFQIGFFQSLDVLCGFWGGGNANPHYPLWYPTQPLLSVIIR